MKTSNIFLIILGFVAVFLFGYQFKKKESDIARYAGQVALNEGTKYVKKEANVTGDWFKSLGTYWKSVWK